MKTIVESITVTVARKYVGEESTELVKVSLTPAGYAQWGAPISVLGENVDLASALLHAAHDARAFEDDGESGE